MSTPTQTQPRTRDGRFSTKAIVESDGGLDALTLGDMTDPWDFPDVDPYDASTFPTAAPF